MEINGFALREAIRQWDFRKEAAEKAFKGSLHRFEKDQKDAPQQVVEAFLLAEESIAKLQVAQMRYNLAVTVRLRTSETMTLAEAIKLVGSAGRIEKMWKSTLPDDKHSRYSLNDGLTRDPTQERAIATVDAKTVVKLASQASKRTGDLRAAIAVANGTTVTIEGLYPALFE